MSSCKVQCPRCRGLGWFSVHDDGSFIMRKLKCGICDAHGNAHVQDIIDYYEYLSDKAPEEDKVKRWKAYLNLSSQECTNQDATPTER